MKGIIGTICGDIIGSSREFRPKKTKDFRLYNRYSTFTDDTVMTLAIASWLMKDKNSREVLISEIKKFGLMYPKAGYGGMFRDWLSQDSPEPYGSWANGSAMRVSPVSWVSETLEESQKLAIMSADVTHNHPEGIKGALATNDAIFLARNSFTKEEIKKSSFPDILTRVTKEIAEAICKQFDIGMFTLRENAKISYELKTEREKTVAGNLKVVEE